MVTGHRTTPHSPLTTHYPPLTTHHSPLTTHHPLIIARFADNVLRNIDGDVGGDRQCDRIARTAVDFDQFSVLANSELRVVGVVAQLVDVDILKFRAQVVDHIGDKVVGQWPWGVFFPDTASDAGRFEYADDDRKNPIAVDFLQPDHLMVDDLANDDPLKFHLYRHGQPRFQTWLVKPVSH